MIDTRCWAHGRMMSTRITLQRLDSFRLLHISLYKSFRNPSLHLEPRRVRVAVKSRNVKDAQVDDDFGLHIDNDDAVCLRQAARVPDSGLVQFKVENTLDYHQTDVTSRRSTIARWAMAVIMWVAGEQNCKAKASEKVKYVAQKEGFQFEYPSESFVVAFDRTGGGTKDGALVSVGDFTRYIVVSVFQQQQSQRIPGSLDAESGYALCLDPVIQADSTVGFRVIEALMVQPVGKRPADADGSYEDGRNRKGVFAFEYQVSICRGDTILEGKGGALRCQGVFGQDVPIQDKHVAGRAFINTKGNLVTIMASVPKDTWKSSEQVVREIINSFRPI